MKRSPIALAVQKIEWELNTKRDLQLFPAAETLDFAAMSILRPLSKTAQGNQFVLVITDRNFKLTRSISTLKKSSTRMENVFHKVWIIPIRIPSNHVTEKGSQSVSKFFTIIYRYLGVRYIASTAYEAQKIDQAKRNSPKMVSRLCQYFAELQRNRDLFFRLLIYAYKTQILHRTDKSS